MKTFLIIGNCGVGKTWIMKQLINLLDIKKKEKFSKINYNTNGRIYILGNYDGSTFEGSDRLSMSVATDFEPFYQHISKEGTILICEGDRFMNKKFIEIFRPIILKIEGDGEEGRKIRKSTQTERQLKSINTRVNNIQHELSFKNSGEAFEYLKNIK